MVDGELPKRQTVWPSAERPAKSVSAIALLMMRWPILGCERLKAWTPSSASSGVKLRPASSFSPKVGSIWSAAAYGAAPMRRPLPSGASDTPLLLLLSLLLP